MHASILKPLQPSDMPRLMQPMGQASCGQPLHGLDFPEDPMSLDELLQIKEHSTFLGQAYGQSMTGIGILDGDWLVVDRSIESALGDAVVALVGGDFTVKTLSLNSRGQMALQAENPLATPITIGEGEHIEIFGVVTCAIRCFKNLRVKR